MADPLLSRKRDLVYLIYFTIAIPISFIVDLQPIYPEHLIPNWMLGITDFYIRTYNDQFFVKAPPFFLGFIWSEALIQVPIMIWGWHALFHNSPKVPLLLLPFSSLIFITTATCMVEFWSWSVPFSHRLHLTTLYGPYLTLSGVMFVDMWLRLKTLIDRTSVDASEHQKKRQ